MCIYHYSFVWFTAWLRNRRAEPPSETELKDNLTLSITKKENADKLALRAGKNPEEVLKVREYVFHGML